jgi:hypothetical protein
MMRRIANVLLALGLLVGAADAAALYFHLGIAGVPWLVNVALAKLGFVAALGILAGGAVAGRLAHREEERLLGSGGTAHRERP